MIWLAAIAAILVLYLLVGLTVLVLSAPEPGDPDDITNASAALLVVAWLPLLAVVLVRGGHRR